jgi:hypothetical protein
MDDKEVRDQLFIAIREGNEANKAMAQAMQAVATAVSSIGETQREHTRSLDEHSLTVDRLVTTIQARQAIWKEMIDTVKDYKVLSGIVIGIILTVAVLGPLVMASLPSTLSTLGVEDAVPAPAEIP